MLLVEEFRRVVGYPDYLISNHGRLYMMDRIVPDGRRFKAGNYRGRWARGA